jgi:hypothetical protein
LGCWGAKEDEDVEEERVGRDGDGDAAAVEKR